MSNEEKRKKTLCINEGMKESTKHWNEARNSLSGKSVTMTKSLAWSTVKLNELKKNDWEGLRIALYSEKTKTGSSTFSFNLLSRNTTAIAIPTVSNKKLK